jgi:exonuclease SbcD
VIRVLHTSDWHLGATLGELNRDEEHGLFLDWLLATIEAEQVDVLAIAGDVFHQAQPSAEAQRRYYRFLAALQGTRLLRTIIVGGNHDSQARLDAPRDLLDSLDVTVVGGLESIDDPRLAVVVNDRTGAPALGVAAVPFVHEYRLGVRLHAAPAEIAADMRARFGDLYTRVADELATHAPGVPLLAMGHLTCGDVDRAWVGDEIHSVGGSYVLGPDLFDPRYVYVALGHIHGCYPVDETRRVWYSGSPVGIRDKELKTDRNVLLIDLDDAGVCAHRRMPVPRFRDVFDLRGSLGDVLRDLRGLSSDAPLRPGLLVTIHTEEPVPSADDQIRAELDRFPSARRPIRCLATKFVRAARTGTDDAAGTPPAGLRSMHPEEVFERAFRARLGSDPSDADRLRFRTLLTMED